LVQRSKREAAEVLKEKSGKFMIFGVKAATTMQTIYTTPFC